MELWASPYEGREIAIEATHINGLYRQVAVDGQTREPIRDRFGRVVAGTTSDGCFRVYAVDGHEVVSGYVQHDDMRINMYTGEAFKNGHRVRRPDRGPLAGQVLGLVSERASVRRYDR
jgi:hypothetical protein